jgi:2,4-diaminopentanoate dehydrogenase
VADAVSVLILGTGRMGGGIARLLLERPGLALAGAFARRIERRGLDLGTVIGLGREIGIPIGNDLAALVEQTRPHIAIQATCSRLADARPEIEALLRRRVAVISIAEEMAFPAASAPQAARELHELAVAQGVALLGTGVNPGFVLDLLVIALSGVCAEVSAITARRVNDLAPYGPSVLDAQGVGLSPEAFEEGLNEGSVVGHFGFNESIAMIGHALGWRFDHIEQRREPIIARVRRVTPGRIVEPGHVAGCNHSAVAWRGGRPVITLIHPQQVAPEAEGIATGDDILIEGRPRIHLSGSPEIPGGEATIALAVNMIPRVLAAAPGLYSMADLPVPAARLGMAPWAMPGTPA